MTRWLLVLSLIPGLAGGCSFALSGPDPKAPRNQAPSCDTSKSLVVVDGLLATASGVTMLAVGADNGAAAIVPAAIGALFVGAAIHGSNVVDQCRKANEEYVAALSAQRRVPVVAADDDADETPHRLPAKPRRPQPAAEPAVQTTQAPAVPVQPPPQPPASAPPQPPQPRPVPTYEVWADFWKEVR